MESKRHERKVHKLTIEGDECYSFNCPHCDGTIIVKCCEVNCHIFRHGVYKNQPGQPINPHESEANVRFLTDSNLIYGCGKPIMLYSDKSIVFSCDYI